ncbi:GH3 auxin-responsive promoter family protein [Algivirga pacifica]
MAFSFINSAVNWYFKRRMEDIEFFMRNPLEAQDRIFNQLLSSAQNTEWGKKYQYREIKDIYQYQQQVPVSAYEDLYPYIERMMKGEQNILWSSKITCFSKSSGTTNARSKFIPVSEEAFEETHYKTGKDMLSIFVTKYPDTKMFSGKSLAIGGTYQENEQFKDSYYGDVSGLIMKNLPFWAEYLRSPSKEVALMDEWEAKIERLAEATIKENITNLAGVPTWTLVLMERILEMTGKKDISEVWPNLEVFFHGAVAFGPYRESFKSLISNPKMRYVDVYNASEGYFGIQDTDRHDELLLMLDNGIYYEFIPMEEWDNEHPKTVTLADVEIGKNYAMLISTNAGLWRYKIGDTVRFTSTDPYRIKISGRTKHFINAFGEEVVIENAEMGITKACQMTGALVKNFTAAPIYLEAGKKGGHEWVIEFDKDPSDFDLFCKVLDQTIQEVNSDYEAKRWKDIALLPPVVHHAPSGTFYNWMKGRGKLGGQNKVPRLANHREYMDSLLELLK